MSLNSMDASNTTLNLVSPCYSTGVLRGFQNLRNDLSLCDFTIIVEGTEFPIHKVLFAAVSDYFQALFNKDMRESRENKVELIDITEDGVSRLIDFVYTGELFVDMNNIYDIVATSSRLQIRPALDLCNTFLKERITLETCVDILNLAETFGLSRVHETAQGYILDRFTKIAGSSELYKLSKAQLISFLKNNSLKCNSEFELFSCVISWLKHDPGTIRQNSFEVLSHIRFPLMTPEELLEQIGHEPIVMENPDCLSLYNDAKDYHFFRHIPRKQADVFSERCQVRNKPGLVAIHQFQGLSILMGNNWLKLADVGHNAQWCSTAVMNNFLYMCGGFIDGIGPTNLCVCFDPRFMELKSIASMNECRVSFQLVAVGRSLYAIGGSNTGIQAGGNYSSVEAYSIKDDQWSFIAPYPLAVERHAACEFMNRVYVSGGADVQSEQATDKMMSYDPVSNEWVELSPMLNTHSKHFMTKLGDMIYVVDGNKCGPSEQVEQYNPSINQWTSIECNVNLLSPLDGCLALYGNWLYFVCPRWGTTLGGRTFRFNLLSLECEELAEYSGEKLKGRLCMTVLTLPQHVVPLLSKVEVQLTVLRTQ